MSALRPELAKGTSPWVNAVVSISTGARTSCFRWLWRRRLPASPTISGNPDTQYQNGIDFHIDWGASQFLSKQLFVGLVGYHYQQIADDFGQPPILGGFRSRVVGVGPQIGYLFPVGEWQEYLNLKGYGEFAAENRPAGWNTWLTFSLSPMAPPSTVAPTRRIVTK